MKREKYRLVTAESVRAGHPDKLCDQIADEILDAYLRKDPKARVAVEVMATDGKLLVAGEVTSEAKVRLPKTVNGVLDRIQYRPEDLTSDQNRELEIEVCIHEQSPDISKAVGDGDDIGAGDQGIVVGYATDETPEYLPLPVVLAHRICHELDRLRMPDVGADGKAQVTVMYDGDKPVGVSTVVVSAQYADHVDEERFDLEVFHHVLHRVIPAHLWRDGTKIHVNPSGRFVLGGPVADTGLTGRKLAVDQYGPVARIGGGALSGKDPTKVDRSGAYAARWVAKNIVAAGLAKRCEVQIAYAIGRARPVSVSVDAFNTNTVPGWVLEKAVRESFDLRPAAIIRELDLRRPIYAPLAVYGHFGRQELNLPWEQTNKRGALLASVVKQGYSV